MQQNQTVVRRAATAFAVGAMIGLAAGAATAGTVKVKKDLTATSVDANARGKTALSLRSGAKGKFEVKANRLTHNASFDVVIRGVKVGTLQTNNGGSGKVRFNTKPGSRDVALGFDPRGATVDIRDDNGDDVLVGDIPDDSVDPTEVACCLAQTGSHEGEVECEDMTPEACTAANGASAGVASCLPDPCGSTPLPETEIVCCTNQTGDDESASECEDETEAECAAAGGMVVQATSCDPNPCAPTQPTTETACCAPSPTNSSEIECEVTTPEACTALQGVAVDGGTCSTDPCGTGSSGSGN